MRQPSHNTTEQTNISDSTKDELLRLKRQRLNREAMWSIGKTIASVASSVGGIRGFYDVPAYFYQRQQIYGDIGGVLKTGGGLTGSATALLAKRDQFLDEIKESKGLESNTVRTAIKDLNHRLELTQQGTVKKSELRSEMARILWQYRTDKESDRSEISKQITRLLDEYGEQKVTATVATREGLRTALLGLGAYSLAAIGTLSVDAVAFRNKVKKEAELAGIDYDKRHLAKKFAESVRKNWQKLKGSEPENNQKVGLQKWVDRATAAGKFIRVGGVAAGLSLDPDRYGADIGKLAEINLDQIPANFTDYWSLLYDRGKLVFTKAGEMAGSFFVPSALGDEPAPLPTLASIAVDRVTKIPSPTPLATNETGSTTPTGQPTASETAEPPSPVPDTPVTQDDQGELAITPGSAAHHADNVLFSLYNGANKDATLVVLATNPSHANAPEAGTIRETPPTVSRAGSLPRTPDTQRISDDQGEPAIEPGSAGALADSALFGEILATSPAPPPTDAPEAVAIETAIPAPSETVVTTPTAEATTEVTAPPPVVSDTNETPLVAPEPIRTTTPVSQLMTELEKHPDYRVNAGDRLHKIVETKLLAHCDSFGQLPPEDQAGLIKIVRERIDAMSRKELKEFGVSSGNKNQLRIGEELNFSVVFDEKTTNLIEVKFATIDPIPATAATAMDSSIALTQKLDTLTTDISELHSVKKGENVWSIIEAKLKNAGLLKGLSETQQNYLIDSLKDKVEANPKSIGIAGNNADLIYPGERLNLSEVMQPETIKAVLEEAGVLADENPPGTVTTPSAQPNEPATATSTETAKTTPVPETTASTPPTKPTEGTSSPEPVPATQTRTIQAPASTPEPIITAPDATEFKIAREMSTGLAKSSYLSRRDITGLRLGDDTEANKQWSSISKELVSEVIAKQTFPSTPTIAGSDHVPDKLYGLDSKLVTDITKEQIRTLEALYGQPPRVGQTVGQYFEHSTAHILDKADKVLKITPNVDANGTLIESFEDFVKRMEKEATERSGLVRQREESSADFIKRAYAKLSNQ